MLGRLVDLGNTVIVIEHNLDVIKTADWIIDLGPGAATAGGRVVATGTPEQIAALEDNHTGHYLRECLIETGRRPPGEGGGGARGKSEKRVGWST